MPPSDSGLEKLNADLFMALQAWEQEPERQPDDGITLTLRFEGDLAPMEGLGFETHAVSNDEAMGAVRFSDLRALAAHPGVLWMETGEPRRISLDTAVRDIKARASKADAVGGDGVWHPVGDAFGTLKSVPDGTGKDVIVAIIDTGIDFTHPMFMKSLGPPKVTRIMRIWDQGLVPTRRQDCPDENLLNPGGTYGVEFDNFEIEAALNGGAPIKHQDSNGHGTHVAGIAAGGPLFPAGGDASRVGVAPEADIIAVKLEDNPEPIRYKLAAGMGHAVDWDRRWRDAVLYCLRTAKYVLKKPVVINMSVSSIHQAGDGLDQNSRWLDARLDPSKPVDTKKMNFPTGAILVTCVPNVADDQAARITVPQAGQIIVPIEIKDDRKGANTTWKNGKDRVHSPFLRTTFWYRRNFDKVKFALRFPHQTTFSTDLGVGGHLIQSLRLNPGPPPSLSILQLQSGSANHKVACLHGVEPSVPHPSGGTVRRHVLTLFVEPKVRRRTVTYLTGIYEVRITAPAGTEVFFMGDRQAWAANTAVTMLIAGTMADGQPLPQEVNITQEFSATDTLGQHAITVAAYDDTDHTIFANSSRGPLRDYSDPPRPPIATKPELAAPGVDIDSAQSADSNAGPGVRTASWRAGVRFTMKDGTSMAAPMVTGVIALMLDKNPSLNTTQVRTLLTKAAKNRPGVDPAAPGTAHDRAYGSGMADALESHKPPPPP
ncbi:MAG: S8 family serine peptidase [Candidatus Polarisedimenticolia bacterium]